MDNRRKYLRVNKNSSVIISEYCIPMVSEDYDAYLVNISASGALIKINKYFEPGTLLKLRITIQGWDKYIPSYLRFEKADYTEPFISLGKVTRVDEAKHEVTIELIEAAIPIPITVSIESVKIIEQAEKESK